MSDQRRAELSDLASFQSLFSRMVIDRASEVETSQGTLNQMLHPCQRDQVGKRLAIYRNNVHYSLVQALADSFPVVKQLVGDDFFTAMAREYLYHSPPTSALLLEFGCDFSTFIATFPPAQSLGYLADIADLEYAWQQAYHAADCISASADDFAAIPMQQLLEQPLSCHPSMQLLASRYAIGSLWQAHQISEGDQQTGLDLNIEQPEWLVIVRPEYDVKLCFLDEPGFQFVASIRAGIPIGGVSAELMTSFPNWDLSQSLAFAVRNGFFTFEYNAEQMKE